MPATLTECEPLQVDADARERLRAFWAGSSLGRPALRVLVKRPDFREPTWPGPELDAKARAPITRIERAC